MTDKMQLAWQLQSVIEAATKAKAQAAAGNTEYVRFWLEQLDAEYRQVCRTINVD